MNISKSDFSFPGLIYVFFLLNEDKFIVYPGTSQGALLVKNLPVSAGDARDSGSISGSGRSLEKEMATCSSILAWRISWIEAPGRLQSMGSQRVGHD